ncbi:MULTISPECIES: hypothetical protein [unclassified Paraburkholderia]|uniref:hypothetical protein n=1 Tax=unclassified Paraburkholderia TaxID=2615204 RepID=UPI001620D785|nr:MULTISPECIES: hypothetical protein [unclassified Paraburkholderia]MBB5445456.1 hypothetical protein [Paraburkholderia sp. WSM4177]MBB5486064.1 hypothetical protein [Paraburkholderia sp. WSM4180]
MKKDFMVVFAVVVAVTLIVIFTSTIFFSRHLRLYDYGPPLGAGIITLAMMIRSALSER